MKHDSFEALHRRDKPKTATTNAERTCAQKSSSSPLPWIYSYPNPVRLRIGSGPPWSINMDAETQTIGINGGRSVASFVGNEGGEEIAGWIKNGRSGARGSGRVKLDACSHVSLDHQTPHGLTNNCSAQPSILASI